MKIIIAIESFLIVFLAALLVVTNRSFVKRILGRIRIIFDAVMTDVRRQNKKGKVEGVPEVNKESMEELKGESLLPDSKEDVGEFGLKPDSSVGSESLAVSEVEECQDDIQVNDFAVNSRYWTAVGVSVIGSGHVSSGLPCQDNNGYLYLGDGWGIAVVSDGAGSAVNSQIGSLITVKSSLRHFSQLVRARGWKNSSELPGDEEWNETSYRILSAVKRDIKEFALKEKMEVSSLNATVIVVIHSPKGLLVCHVGDGRAGYKGEDGVWRAMITPHKGEEANQTVFLPSDFWEAPYFRLSGVRIPEARVIRERVAAFTLMSDGCENTCWDYYHFNPATNRYFDPNTPHSPLFDSLCGTIRNFTEDNGEPSELLANWREYVASGNDGFRKETDDKTLLLVVAKIQQNRRTTER